VREAEESQRPAAAEIIGRQGAAVLVLERQWRQRSCGLQQRRALERRWRRSWREQHPGGNEPECKRYNGEYAEPDRWACSHERSVAPALGRLDFDYPITSARALRLPKPFRHRLPKEPTVESMIRYGAKEFELAGLAFGHGTGDATDDAAALVFHVLQLDHANAAAVYARPLSAADVQAVVALFAARIESKMPAAYLMGRMWFAGLEFEVDPCVLVPRSPVAELIDASFEPWVEPGRVRRLLDIGTGSGCIAIACAVRFPDAQVDAVDLSPGALAIARRNAARHGVEARVHFHLGDVFEPLGGQRYDLIVSNPPYVSDAEMAELPREYLHEPDVALRAGTDGLDVARAILRGAESRLNPQGVLFVEVGESEERLQAAFPRVPFLWLDFERGGAGVFMLTKDELRRHRRDLSGAV
jgi:ribosomal protein L3 glutamine methyltransferase